MGRASKHNLLTCILRGRVRELNPDHDLIFFPPELLSKLF
jgi:hypothetical protein